MKLLVYHPWIKQKGGAERVILEYADRSVHDVSIFTGFYDEDQTFEGFRDLAVNVIGPNVRPTNFLRKGVWFGLGSIQWELPLDQYDSFLVSEAGIGSLIALRNNGIPTFCYCHTPLRPALPEFRESYLREQPTGLRLAYREALQVYDRLERRAWEKFDAVVVNSHTTKRRVLTKGLAREDEISVQHPGADVEGNREGEFRPYFLYPSRFRRYKRQHLAVEAFKRAGLEGFELVLAGSNQETEYVDRLRSMVDGDDRIRIETDVADERWRQLYRHCYSVVFLPEKEDWGIIPIEAGSHGKPCIAVNDGGPSESIIDGRTGLLVEPTVPEVADAMRRLSEDREAVRAMGERARAESARYSWDRFAGELDEKITNWVDTPVPSRPGTNVVDSKST